MKLLVALLLPIAALLVIFPQRVATVAQIVSMNLQVIGEGGSHVTHQALYLGGPVQHQPAVYLVFWRPPGMAYEPGGNDDTYINLIARYEHDVPGSSYAAILTQYADAGTGTPPGDFSLAGIFVDIRSYPTAAMAAEPLHDADVRAELTTVIDAQHLPATVDTEYIVFTTAGAVTCPASGGSDCTLTSNCGYHDSFAQGDKTIVYALIPDPADQTSCAAQDGQGTPYAPNANVRADAAILALSHEQTEMLTDPLLHSHPAWVNLIDGETGDLCAWNLGPLQPDGSNVLLHGHKYLVQTIWSDAAGQCVLAG
jgi:hypothetical protein